MKRNKRIDKRLKENKVTDKVERKLKRKLKTKGRNIKCKNWMKRMKLERIKRKTRKKSIKVLQGQIGRTEKIRTWKIERNMKRKSSD